MSYLTENGSKCEKNKENQRKLKENKVKSKENVITGGFGVGGIGVCPGVV